MWHRYRFSILLATLLVLLIASPVVEALEEGVSRGLFTVLFIATLISAIMAGSEGRISGTCGWMMAISAIVIHFFATPNGILDVVGQFLAAAFLAFCCALILHFLFTTENVTLDTIYASICVYVLIAVLWAMGYSALSSLNPESFRGLADNDYVKLHFSGDDPVIPLYFSLVTMTTLGYGDIVPCHPVSRTACMLQSVVGLMYISLLVARLVGLHIAQATKKQAAHDKDEGG